MPSWPGLLALPAESPQQARPSLTLFFLLEGAFVLTLVPHAVQFPLWLTLTIGVAIAIRSFMEAYRLPLPSTWLSSFLAMVFLGVIVASYGGVEGRDAGTAFTAGLLAIKFYEIRRPRDLSLIIFSCFFMVMSSLLYAQFLELFIYCLIMMWVLTALLLRVHLGDAPEDGLMPMLGKSGLIFVQALPLMLLLFFFLPRYTGTISFSMGDAKIGLSDTVAPGSIARLSEDDTEAFRVHFDKGNVPTTDTMYWRGLVLWDYSYGVWTAGAPATSLERTEPHATSAADDVEQTITVDPHNQKWLFALDVPLHAPINDSENPSWGVLLNGGVVQLGGSLKLNHMSRYHVTSSSVRAEEELTAVEHDMATHLPDDSGDHVSSEVKQLARDLAKGQDQPDALEYAYAVLRYFHHQGFRYSTSPGLLKPGPDWLGDFLLHSKIGFCEHFASSFAVLMRLEHVPCRVVVGYLGADYNPYSDLYAVAQSNAHAWDEIWIPSRTHPADMPHNAPKQWGQWKRIDPTALVGGLDPGEAATRTADASDPLSRQIAQRAPGFSDRYLPSWMRTALKEMTLRRLEVEAGWDDLVFSYDPEVQLRLAQAMGFGNKTTFGLLALCVLLGGAWLWGLRRWVGRRVPVSPVESLYAAFCRNMAQRGIPRASWEGPLAYTERVAEAFPDDEATLRWVGDLVARARYGAGPVDAATPEKLKSLLTLLSASQAALSSREPE